MSDWRTVLFGAGLTLAIGCIDAEAPHGPPFRAYVIDQIAVDPQTGKGEFAVAARDLEHLTRLTSLEGPLYRILRGGQLKARILGGSIVLDGSFSEGAPPELRYRLEAGKIVARDYSTLAMLSAARQFERVFDALDRYGPYSADQLVAGIGRPNIYFEPTIEISGSVSATAIQKFNAFFEPRGGDFGLARRSSAEDVPLAGDVKVIAHEVGHAVFFMAFDAAHYERCQNDAHNRTQPWFPGRLDYEYAMRGLNEGFADWHAFSITGSVNPLANQSAVRRPRNLRLGSYVWRDLEPGIPANEGEDTDPPAPCIGGFYCIGTLFAHALYATYVTLGNDPGEAEQRAAFTGEIVAALEHTKNTLQERGRLPDADASAAACKTRDEFDAGQDAAVVGAFFDALLANLDTVLRMPLCAALIDTFGARGFAEEYRGECAP